MQLTISDTYANKSSPKKSSPKKSSPKKSSPKKSSPKKSSPKKSSPKKSSAHAKSKKSSTHKKGLEVGSKLGKLGSLAKKGAAGLLTGAQDKIVMAACLKGFENIKLPIPIPIPDFIKNPVCESTKEAVVKALHKMIKK